MNATAMNTAAGRYGQLSSIRSPYLTRGRDAAKVTIPSLLPPEGSNEATILYTPYQSMGAEGVNHLSSKLLIALFPPNTPFFKHAIDDDYALQEATQAEGMRGKVEEALSVYDRAILADIEGRAIRAPLHEALKHLLTSGNVLGYLPPKGSIRAYGLDRYVVLRDADGTPLEIILEEEVDVAALPDDIRKAANLVATNGKPAPQRIKKYTHVRLEGDQYKVYEEINGYVPPTTRGTYPKDACPWMPLRWSWVAGEHYGRGMCSDHYLGDLLSLEGLSKAMVEAAAAAARVIPLVNPNGMTDEKELQDAENFDFVAGRAEDVTFLQMDKYADFRVAETMIQRLEQRLGRAFMLTSSIQRNGERVTAEEIRIMAADLEDNLGGVYSILSQELQLPIVRRVVALLSRMGRLPKLPDDTVKVNITTGMEALGRGHDMARLRDFVRVGAEVMGPEAVMQDLHRDELWSRLAASMGIDRKGLVKTPEEKMQEQQAMMAQQAALAAVPNAVNQMGQMAQNNMAPPA